MHCVRRFSLPFDKVLAALVFSSEAAEPVVEIRDCRLQSPALRVKPGDSVRWVSREKPTGHSVLFSGSSGLESDRMFPDESCVVATLRSDRQLSFCCGPHPEMSGVVEVLE